VGFIVTHKRKLALYSLLDTRYDDSKNHQEHQLQQPQQQQPQQTRMSTMFQISNQKTTNGGGAAAVGVSSSSSPGTKQRRENNDSEADNDSDFDSHSSGKAKTIDDDEQPQIAKRENVLVEYSRYLVMLVLLLSAGLVAYFTYDYVQGSEQGDFKAQVRDGVFRWLLFLKLVGWLVGFFKVFIVRTVWYQPQSFFIGLIFAFFVCACMGVYFSTQSPKSDCPHDAIIPSPPQKKNETVLQRRQGID
jgi:hypothetical protein